MSNLGPVSELGKQRQNTITSFLSKPTSKSATECGASSTGREPDRPGVSSVISAKEITRGQDVSVDSDTRKQSGLGTLPNIAEKTGSELHIDKGSKKEINRVTEPIICPVCGRTIKTTRIELIHEHINFCLEKGSNSNIESVNEQNETSSSVADVHVCSTANGPVSNMADGVMSKMTEEPMSNMVDESMFNMVDEPVSSMADEPMSNMADEPMSNMAAEPMSNMADEPTTSSSKEKPESSRTIGLLSEPSVKEVNCAGNSHKITSELPSIDTSGLKDSSTIFSHNLDSCDKDVSRTSDRNNIRDESFKDAVKENQGYQNQKLKTAESNCYNSTNCIDKYKFNISSKFGVTYIPLFSNSHGEDHGNGELARQSRSNVPVKDSQKTTTEQLRVSDPLSTLTKARTTKDEIELKSSPVSSSKVKQHLQNRSPGPTHADSSPTRDKQRPLYARQTKSTKLKEIPNSIEGISQGGAFDCDLNSGHSTTTQNSPPEMEINIQVQKHNKDTRQGNAESKIVTTPAEMTLDLNAPASSMFGASDNQTLNTKLQPSTGNKSSVVSLNEKKESTSLSYFQNVCNKENRSIADFPLRNASSLKGGSITVKHSEQSSNISSSLQTKGNIEISEEISHENSVSHYAKPTKFQGNSSKGESNCESSNANFCVIASNSGIAIPDLAIAKDNILSKDQSIDKKSLLSDTVGASPNYSPSSSIPFSSKTTIDPVTESSSIPSQMSPSAKSMFTCPVCDMKVSATLAFFNKHLDACLSKQTIKDMVGNNNNNVVRSPVASNKKNASGSKLKNPKDAKRRRMDDGQKSMASFLTSSK